MDKDLGRVVDDRLITWAEHSGFSPDELGQWRTIGFGQYAMLLHPDTDDPDQLLLAARWLATVFTIDDRCTDDHNLGANPTTLASKYALILPALDQPPIPADCTTNLNQALVADPMLVAITSSLTYLSNQATPSQIARIRHEYMELLIACATQSAWRHDSYMPSPWMYLTSRSFNNFHPAITLIDVVGGYEVPADLYFEPRVRRATILAATAANMVNDLYSVAKDCASGTGELNFPQVVAADKRCSLQEAINVTINLHNSLMKSLNAQCAEIAHIRSPALHRFLTGLTAWVAGNREWHSRTSRYKVPHANSFEG
ncbi:terpene synthase [Streptomyces sp. KLMMK]|uniref:terpene synthase family protein n=1 Tax=Streptomyces sp. KLMMK TaxID=3109353 RepID=UPI003009298D